MSEDIETNGRDGAGAGAAADGGSDDGGAAADRAAAGSAAAHLHTSGADLTLLRQRLAAWLGQRLERPTMSDISLPAGNGVSSDTLLFDVAWGGRGGRRAQACAARLEPDPATHRVFPRYDLAAQARVMRLVAERTDVPVPAVLWEEPDPTVLGTPFFVMEQVEGIVPPDVMPYPFGSWVTDATPEQRRIMQEGVVEVLARLHTMAVSLPELEFLQEAHTATSPLRAHVDTTRRYYEWVVERGGGRAPVLDAGFEWIERHWPAREPPACLTWGDARVGNVLFRDFRPVGVLDWEMSAIGPGALDVGWLVYLHRFLDDIAAEAGLPGLPDLLRPDDVAAGYEAAGGGTIDDLPFYATYAAVRMGAVILREQQRPLLSQGLPLPGDLDSLVIHQHSLRRMLAGDYWDAWTG